MSEQGDPVATLFVVSDGTGETAAAVVRAVMLQFQTSCRTRVVGSVRRESQARRVVAEAERASGIIVFSLVNKQVAEVLLREAELRGVATVDLLGPMISKVAQHLRAEPRLEPGLLHGFSDDYFKRIEAVEFAVQHDEEKLIGIIRKTWRKMSRAGQIAALKLSLTPELQTLVSRSIGSQ